MKANLAIPALALCLAACSPEPAPTSDPADQANPPVAQPAATGTLDPSGAGTETAAPTAAADTLSLEGLGDLRIGQPVPPGSTWFERGAQIPGNCRTVTSVDYPGVYAIVEGGKVRRITAGERSNVKLVEGIGVGATEKEAKSWFPFPETPHKYEPAPAKYLTAPNARGGSSALRLEIGQDGKVKLIHVGTMPQLAYVEGCA